MSQTLLQVNNLKTYFFAEGVIRAVDDVTFHISKGETVGVVGESGCGKSVTALSLMRLIPTPPGRIVSGEVLLEGKNLLEMNEQSIRRIRGCQISMVFQEPMSSLNPVHTIGMQICETLQLHRKMGHREALNTAVELLRRVGIPLPEQRVYEYPHQLSGGMCQRVMIAMALSCNPKLLIADEPTTALDVTIQAQILELLKDLKKRSNMAILIITHDLGVIADLAERVLIMYAGKVVEEARVRSLFKEPLHPYTGGLLESIPRIKATRDRLHVIEGMVPNPSEYPPGCRSHPRCKHRQPICSEQEPPLISLNGGRRIRCWLVQNRLSGGVVK